MNKSLLFLVSILLFSCQPHENSIESQPYNVLLLAIDDMNDWTTLFHPSNPIKTPNLEKLAASGTFFSKAYANSPACNPSRTSLLMGLRPSTTGVYGNSTSWRDVLAVDQLLPAYFQQNGYQIYTAGKVFHHHRPEHAEYEIFDAALPFPGWPPDAPMPPELLNGFDSVYDRNGKSEPMFSPNFDWGVWPENEEDHIDHRTADWVLDRLSRVEGPFYLQAGIFRPHAPTFAPQEYFDMYPLESIQMPELLENDLEDIPEAARELLHQPNYRWFSTIKWYTENKDSLTYKKAVQGYMAAASYCDYQIGRILDALKANDLDKNTIVVLFSDHGYFLGQKERWEKFALYEIANHVPFIIYTPGLDQVAKSDVPVSLIDIYPTLVELANLPPKDNLEGNSLVPVLKTGALPVAEPVITTYEKNNHSIRGDEYRYNRYADGSEELYHVSSDPNEWHNMASDPEKRKIMDSLAQWLPVLNANISKNAR